MTHDDLFELFDFKRKGCPAVPANIMLHISITSYTKSTLAQLFPNCPLGALDLVLELVVVVVVVVEVVAPLALVVEDAVAAVDAIVVAVLSRQQPVLQVQFHVGAFDC